MVRTVTHSSIYAAVVALVWSGVYFVNEYIFEAAQYTRVANLIFLPAMIRPLAILLCGNAGFVGLFLGAMITFPLEPQSLSSLLLVSLASSAPAWVAIRWLGSMPQFASELSCDLSGLRLSTIMLITSVTAALSATTHQVVFWFIPQIEASLGQLMSMFFGDLVGSFLMLHLLSTLLRFSKQKRAELDT